MYERLDKAIQWAAKLHSGQFRDGQNPLPYITHPVEVLSYLRHIGGVVDEDLLCTAVLHDIIEESSTKPSEVEKQFGQRVRELVVELTREEPTLEQIKGLSKDEVWQFRSSMLLEEIAKMSTEAQQVKLADRLSNLRQAKATKSPDKVARYMAQTKKILKIVSREVNEPLWISIKRDLS